MGGGEAARRWVEALMEMDGANHAVPAINEHASEEPRTSGSGSVESGKREGDKDNPLLRSLFPEHCWPCAAALLPLLSRR
jgi:hypothetical protein